MRNLIVFIWKHYFFFLFILLEVCAFYLIVQNNYYQHAGFLNSADKLSGNVYQSYSNVSSYLHLKQANEQLSGENAWLRTHAPSAYYALQGKKTLVNDSLYQQQYEYLAARVINNSVNRRTNYLTLNKGSKQGVRPNMGVISGMGVVGIVTNVSAHFCTVMSVLHKDMKLSSMVKKDGAYGYLTWNGSDYRQATLSDIPTSVHLLKGDTIVTSAYSAIFPEGIMVGTVDTWKQVPGEYFYKIRVQLSTDFKKLNDVYIVNNLFSDEQKSIEKQEQHGQ